MKTTGMCLALLPRSEWSSHTCVSALVLCANGQKPHTHEKNMSSKSVAVMKIQQR